MNKSRYDESRKKYVYQNHIVTGHKKGYVIVNATYNSVYGSSRETGISKVQLITNITIKRAFNNAVYNGAIQHFYKKGKRESIGSGEEMKSGFEYKLHYWYIEYTSKNPLYFSYNKKTKTATYKKGKKVFNYKTKGLSTREQSEQIKAYKEKTLKERANDDRYMSSNAYKAQFAEDSEYVIGNNFKKKDFPKKTF